MTIRSVEFRILGPLEVLAGGRVVPLEAPKLRSLLAILLVHANEPVSRDHLIEELWAGRPPTTAAKILKTYVSQLRRALEWDTIRTVPSGYELSIEPGSLDFHRFQQLVDEARVDAPPAAARTLREALALWRGPPLADFAYEPWAQLEIARLEELRLEALQERLDADLALGGDAELVAELELLVAQYPLRERLRGQLMLALYRSGRQADALTAYRDARQALVETLGIEPGPALRQLERAILDQDPNLDLSPVELAAVGPERRRSSLPKRSSSFVGRKRELREIRALLRREDVRLLTLTGAAGSGKTRLAVEAISGLEGDLAEAVLVELAPITDASLVARTIADGLGVRERPGRTPAETLLEHLCDRRALLLLDNFEQVLAAAPSLGELLTGAPGVKILVTSRIPLEVPGERIYSVPALRLPDLSQPRTLARLRQTEAIRLFCDRAREARPAFELADANAGTVAELCVRLDGLPLALELAAARSNLLSSRALLERVGARLDLLKAAPGSGLAERHRTLRAAIEWSYDLLEPELQELFTSLAAFVGGFTLDGAEAVAGELAADILEGVESLLRSNLLTTEHAPGDEPRLGMLETIREYALERLAARGDGEGVRRRHAGYYLTLAEEAESGLLGPQQVMWLERLDAERDNVRAALTWAAAAGEAEVGLRIGSALWRFWQLRNYEREGRERLEQLLALGSASPAIRARAQARIASLAQVQGDHETVRQMLEASLPVHRRLGDERMVAMSLGMLGVTVLAAGDTDGARSLTLEALGVARKTGDPTTESYALAQLGVALAASGQLDDAERTLGEAVRMARKLGNLRSVGSWHMALAGLALIRRDHAQARRLFEESLAVHRSLGDAWGISHALSNLAHLALEADENETARSLLMESLAIERESDGYQPRLGNDLEMSARLAAANGRLRRAVRIYASAALLRESVGVHSMEVGWPDPAPHIADLRSKVGDAEFDAAWARGRAMTLREAIDDAIDETLGLEPAQTPYAVE